MGAWCMCCSRVKQRAQGGCWGWGARKYTAAPWTVFAPSTTYPLCTVLLCSHYNSADCSGRVRACAQGRTRVGGKCRAPGGGMVHVDCCGRAGGWASRTSRLKGPPALGEGYAVHRRRHTPSRGRCVHGLTRCLARCSMHSLSCIERSRPWPARRWAPIVSCGSRARVAARPYARVHAVPGAHADIQDLKSMGLCA